MKAYVLVSRNYDGLEYYDRYFSCEQKAKQVKEEYDSQKDPKTDWDFKWVIEEIEVEE